MPLYEYRCRRCGQVFELLRSRSQRDKAPACELCGCKRTDLVMSGFFGRSGAGGESRSVGSACASCSAGSCSGCRR